MEQLKRAEEEDVYESIDRDMILSAVGNLCKCCELCLCRGGEVAFSSFFRSEV